jgi:endonuclease-3
MKRLTPSEIRTIFKRFKAENPHPTTELIYHNPFQLLIAVLLSAQATDKSVNKATEPLFKIAKTPEDFLKLGEAKLKTYFKTINLYPTKTRHVVATCQMLIDQFHSNIPEDRKSLESLPGVGRKTANVILNTYFGHPTLAVDTHIFRVANRIGLAHGKTPLAVETQLGEVIPKNYQLDAHHWLILHGRYVCLARKPRCGSCLISDICRYPDKTEDL